MTKRYIAIVCIYVLCVLSPLIPGVAWLAGFFPDRSGGGIVTTAIFFLTLVIVLLLLLPERHMRRSSRLTAGESFLWAIGGVFALFVLQILANLINMAIFGKPKESEHTQQIVNVARTSPLFIFAVSVIGPILEEIVFRKIIYGALRKKISFLLAAGISSLIFAVGHFDFQHLLVYFAIGFFLCYVYQKTGRITVNMFMHAAMNAIVVTVSLNATMPGFIFTL
ncbi:CPBP family intramembrane metalloprotease [Sporolactobacillus sp. THM7-7]|nr:CPBP family intramembrane metalloprotease [Sporolactobacillus sp. THM7-7]